MAEYWDSFLSDCTTSYSHHNKLLFCLDTTYTDAINWAIVREDDPILVGEVKHFCSHQKMILKIAQYMGQL